MWKIYFIIYRLLSFLLIPIVYIILLAKNYNNWSYIRRSFEHFGFFKAKLRYPKSIWFTAASIGESLAILPLIKELQKLPYNIVISTNDWGSFLALKHIIAGNVYHSFLPLDNFLIIRKFLNYLSPILFITVEREFFPETLYQVHKSNIRMAIINGRLSDKSAKTFLQFENIFRYFFGFYDQILVQSELDFQNFAKFVVPKKLAITGNIKVNLDISTIKPLLPVINVPVICFASIRKGEENTVICAIKEILDYTTKVIFVICPRFLSENKRFENLIKDIWKAETQDISTIKVSSDIKSHFLLLDSLGNLVRIFASSNIVFMGGSLNKKYGGHNIIEPILMKKPVVIGENYRNFQLIVDELLKLDGIIKTSPAQLGENLILLLNENNTRERLINNSQKFLINHQNATKQTINLLRNFL